MQWGELSFLSVDPLIVPWDPQSHNAYTYARNNPISFTDPTGTHTINYTQVSPDGSVLTWSSFTPEPHGSGPTTSTAPSSPSGAGGLGGVQVVGGPSGGLPGGLPGAPPSSSPSTQSPTSPTSNAPQQGPNQDPYGAGDDGGVEPAFPQLGDLIPIGVGFRKGFGFLKQLFSRNAAKELAKLPVPRTPGGMTPAEFGRAMNWGTGREAATSQIQNLSRESLQKMGLTREMAKQWANFYRSEAARVPQNASAAGRAELMNAAARLLD